MNTSTPSICIIDYGAGNVKSIEFAFKRLGYSTVLSNDVNTIKTADRVIFPGVGQAKSAMEKLVATGLDQVIPTLTQPVLGICLGMQLMCQSSTEGNTKGLGIFDAEVIKFSTQNLKVPQVGWNAISNLKGPLFLNISENEFMYLVHSYYVPIAAQSIGSAYYGEDYTVALHKDNFYGVQFHPEKSGKSGEQLLLNFVNL